MRISKTTWAAIGGGMLGALVLAALAPVALWAVQTYVIPGTPTPRAEVVTNIPNRDEALRSTFSAPNAPTSPAPAEGQQWYEDDTDIPHVYNGSSWLDYVLAGATQTLTNKTLSAPVVSGTVTGTYTLGGTPSMDAAGIATGTLPVARGGTGTTTSTGTGNVVLSAGPTLSGNWGGGTMTNGTVPLARMLVASAEGSSGTAWTTTLTTLTTLPELTVVTGDVILLHYLVNCAGNSTTDTAIFALLKSAGTATIRLVTSTGFSLDSTVAIWQVPTLSGSLTGMNMATAELYVSAGGTATIALRAQTFVANAVSSYIYARAHVLRGT